MILVKTPLRICFFGGGSDLPHYYADKQGLCLSTTIDKYMYVTVCETSVKGVKVVYNEVEHAVSVSAIKHDRIREGLRYYGLSTGLEVSSYAQIPTKGTGLGSSSTFTVGLVNALNHLVGNPVNRRDLAEQAFDIEFNRCKEYLGKQDQYAAAFGGFNSLYFDSKGVTVKPVNMSQYEINTLNSNLLMYYTGITRSASNILKNYEAEKKEDPLDRMVEIGHQAIEALNRRDFDKFGMFLDETWREKRKISQGISSPDLDSKYSYAIECGALGGKILGAGGGGYFLFYVPVERQKKFRALMKDTGMTEFRFNFSDEGSKVVYAD